MHHDFFGHVQKHRGPFRCRHGPLRRTTNCYGRTRISSRRHCDFSKFQNRDRPYENSCMWEIKGALSMPVTLTHTPDPSSSYEAVLLLVTSDLHINVGKERLIKCTSMTIYFNFSKIFNTSGGQFSSQFESRKRNNSVCGSRIRQIYP